MHAIMIDLHWSFGADCTSCLLCDVCGVGGLCVGVGRLGAGGGVAWGWNIHTGLGVTAAQTLAD